MDLITWKPEYVLGIDEIDHHHQLLVEWLNTLHTTLDSTEDLPLIKEICQHLLDYTVFHFDAEEKLMLEGDFPDYATHKEHLSFVNEIKQRYQSIEQENYLITLLELINYLREWLIYHILGSDRVCIDYLLHNQS